MPRTADIARRDVRADMRSIPDAEARRLLAAHGALALRIAAEYPGLDRDELEAVGRIAIMEAVVTHDGRIPLKPWIATVVRWRIRDRAALELRRPDREALVAEPTTNGRHDPERTYQLDQILELLPYLPPRQAVIIDGRLRRETFAEIGATLGISGQWCHQEYNAAMATLRRWLRAGR